MNYFFSAAFIKISLVSAAIFVVIDLLWLALIANKIYYNSLGYLAEIKEGKIVFNLKAGITIQLIIAVGLVFFISMALQINNTLLTSISVGAVSGFILYATYDLTNLSFIKGYTLYISIIDIAWGTAQGFFAGVYVYFLTRFF